MGERKQLKQLCCYIIPDFSVKMSDVSEHSEFDYPKKEEKKKKKEKRGGHIINCLLTDSVMALGPYAMTSIYFPVRPSHSVNKYIVLLLYLFHGNILQSKPSE